MIVASHSAAVGSAHEVGEDDPVEVLASLRRTASLWARQGLRPRTTSGVEELDALLLGGWPVGKVGEIVGPVSSGRTAVAIATMAAATDRGEVAAWIDASDAFDPASALRCGVDLARVLWVRAERVEQAVRAAEIVLETGGVAVVALDLAGPSGTDVGRARIDFSRCGEGPPPFQRGGKGAGETEQIHGKTQRSLVFGTGTERRNTLALRVSRAVERAGSVVLVLAERPWAGPRAGVRVTLQRGAVLWGGERGAPRRLAGLAAHASLDRNEMAGSGRADLCFAWENVTPLTPHPPRFPLPIFRHPDPGPRIPVPGLSGA